MESTLPVASLEPAKVLGKREREAPVSESPHRYGPEVVGHRVRIYWPEDNAFYEGVVEKFTSRGRWHSIRYDDGDYGNVCFSREKVSIC